MVARVFLGLSALVWLPYGIVCFARPETLAEGAGVTATGATGIVELRAMYGGLQIALGVLAALGAMRPALRHPALVTLAFVGAGLGLARLGGALGAADFSGYTVFALVFEGLTAGLGAGLALGARGSDAAVAQPRA